MIGRSLALDVGDRRVGVAISDPLGISARPLTTLVQADGKKQAAEPAVIEALLGLIDEHAPWRIVIGDPRLPSGDRGEQAVKADAFVAALESALQALPDARRPSVLRWDETGSSQVAQARLSAAGVDPREARESLRLDAEAAAVILQECLNADPSTGSMSPAQTERGYT